MTNEMKNVPELRFPGFEGEWRLINLKNCFHTIKNGFVGTATPFYTDNSGVRYLQSNNVKNGFLNDNVKIYVTKEFNEKYKSNQLKSGDMLMVQSGHAGATAVVSDAYEGSNCHALIIMKPKSNINTVFLNNYFQSGKGVKSIYSLITGNTIKHILSSDVKKITFSTPVIGEQEKIGDFFSKLDRQIELEEQKLAKLEEQKKGYMQKVFSQELRFKDENGNDYPEWVEETIPQIIQLITDYVANGSFAAIRENVTYSSVEDYAYVIRLQDASANWKGPFVYTNENAYDFLKKTSLFENDIIMSNVGTVGKFFKVPKMDKPMTLGPNALLFRSESNDMNFLYFYLNSTFFKKKLKRIITPGVQSKVNKTDLKKIAIKMPKLKEQEKIGDFFSRLDEIISKQSQKIGEMKLRKKGFLQKMFI